VFGFDGVGFVVLKFLVLFFGYLCFAIGFGDLLAFEVWLCNIGSDVIVVVLYWCVGGLDAFLGFVISEFCF